ncbi:hypothetical protein JTE90_022165 [Oedothorax gibbosus]|uniref:Uncharacterized protein n=1 Tax=Oedothorax gibbosus TaxID=931172 RepID=A0AAV6VP13_9ARAC|nr:hypothetical protein JTE90_022165 [Oedothorax gibbosus]
MKFCAVLAVMLVVILAIAEAQYNRPAYRRVRPVRIVRPFPLPNKGDQFAASLGGAQVGTLDSTGTTGPDQYGAKPIKI